MPDHAHPADYPLPIIDGDGAMDFSFGNGVQVDDEGLAFTSGRGYRQVRFSEISSIRLHTGFAMANSSPTGICEIRFGNDRKLSVLGGNLSASGEEQRELYGKFVRDLHRRIPPADRSRIAFNGGLSDVRHLIVSTAMIAGALLFGLLPLGLLVLKPSWETLGLMVPAYGLVYAGWRSWNRNRPASYSPDRIPENLFP